MRLFRSLTLLLTLVAPTAFADDLYQVEMILVRQNAVPAIVSPTAAVASMKAPATSSPGDWCSPKTWTEAGMEHPRPRHRCPNHRSPGHTCRGLEGCRA